MLLLIHDELKKLLHHRGPAGQVEVGFVKGKLKEQEITRDHIALLQPKTPRETTRGQTVYWSYFEPLGMGVWDNKLKNSDSKDDYNKCDLIKFDNWLTVIVVKRLQYPKNNLPCMKIHLPKEIMKTRKA